MIVLIMDEMFASFPMELDREFSSIEKAREALKKADSEGWEVGGIKAYEVTLAQGERYVIDDVGFGEFLNFEKIVSDIQSTKQEVDLKLPKPLPKKLAHGTKVRYKGQEMIVTSQTIDLNKTVCEYYSKENGVHEKIVVETKKLVEI